MQKKIYQTALNYLTRREHSQYELIQKLKRKGYPPDLIKQVVNELSENGLQNDKRFAESYLYWRRQKGYGPERISQELRTRGIESEMIAELIDITDNAWFTEVRKIWQKQFKGKIPSDFKVRAKQMRFLQYRGFTREQIESVFHKSATFDE